MGKLARNQGAYGPRTDTRSEIGPAARRRRNRRLLAAGVVLSIGLIAVATLSGRASAAPTTGKGHSYGIDVDATCSTFTVTNEMRVRDEIRGIIRRNATKGRAPDPFGTASEFVRMAAPSCTTYPSRTRNPGEAKLFVYVAKQTLTVLQQENLIALSEVTTFQNMLNVWALGQGIPPGEL